MRSKHLRYKLEIKFWNVREAVQVVVMNKYGPFFTMLFCESMMNAKENPDRKKEIVSSFGNSRTCFF